MWLNKELLENRYSAVYRQVDGWCYLCVCVCGWVHVTVVCVFVVVLVVTVVLVCVCVCVCVYVCVEQFTMDLSDMFSSSC